ncbi:MAG: hypothetical protein ACKV2O_03710 [Acidimicrobiales bacterium]
MLRPTALDDLVKRWDWRSASTIWIAASPGDVAVAFEQVSMMELPAASGTRHRARDGLGGTAPRPVPPALTLLADLLDEGYFLLFEEPERELVLGRVGRFWRPGASATVAVTGRRAFCDFTQAGYAKAALALQIQPIAPQLGGGCLVGVESRVITTDEATRRELSRHQLMGPWATPVGRTELLRVLRQRAEGGAGDA